MKFSHVREGIRAYVDADVETRMRITQQEVWIDYKSSETVFGMMNNIAEVPQRANAPALLVTGAGGTGKSAIISQIHKRVKNSGGLIFLSMAESPEISVKKTLRSELAMALGVPASRATSLKSSVDIPNEIREVIRYRNIWGLVLDEFHDALLRAKQEQRVNMSILKKLLSIEFGLKLFLFGTESAKLAMNSNPEFERRFTVVELGDWKESEEFRAFLLDLEESIPLKNPSCLYSEEMVGKILSITAGRMDKTVDLIRGAACYAIKLGIESITVEMLDKAAKNPWGY